MNPTPNAIQRHQEHYPMAKRPGGELATRPLHFIWIADCSGSMGVDGKIQALNNAIREALPHMRQVADDNPNAAVLVRAVRFSRGADWHVAQPTPVADFRWTDLRAQQVTDMGQAFSLVAEQLRIPPMSDRALPPVLVLISDGEPTDDYVAGLERLMAEPWGRKAVRIAIAMGADANREVLSQFIANPAIPPLEARNPEMLVRHIQWASTAILKAASAPASQALGAIPCGGGVPIPLPPADANGTADAVW